jgi:hypothetical protein
MEWRQQQGSGGWAHGESWGPLPPMTRRELAAYCEARGHPLHPAWVPAERMPCEAVRELAYLDAELETRGILLNREGERAGFDPRSPFQALCVRCNLSKARRVGCRLDHAGEHDVPTTVG